MLRDEDASTGITRRGFLRCAGATAIAGAAMSPSSLLAGTAAPIRSGSDVDLKKVLDVSVGSKLGQMRAAPVEIGSGKPPALLAVHSADANIDPWQAYFRFPEDTLKLTLFTSDGRTLWQRDLGRGVVPGIWFSPVFPFDLDQDGKDEIWILNNTDEEHPLSLQFQYFERLDPETGESTGRWPWTKAPKQSMSHRYRNFIVGGYAHGEPVLVTAQGTYGPMALQAWNADLTKRWEYVIEKDDPGARGSHMVPVVDIDHDGVDEILWGERAISVDTGRELFCADRDTWHGHSDVILPLLDHASGRYYIFTCREKLTTAPRVALYDDRGNRVWGDLESGHVDKGWLARMGENGEAVAMAARIGERGRGGEKLGLEEFTYIAKTGERYPLPFVRYDSIPVDLNGDGLHELAGVRPDVEGGASGRLVLDREGRHIASTEGRVVMASKFLNHPGEQLLTYTPDGRLLVYADQNARDSEAAAKRYRSPAYRLNQKLNAVGYNKVLLGGL